jgi:hypothetical protein
MCENSTNLVTLTASAFNVCMYVCMYVLHVTFYLSMVKCDLFYVKNYVEYTSMMSLTVCICKNVARYNGEDYLRRFTALHKITFSVFFKLKVEQNVTVFLRGL